MKSLACAKRQNKKPPPLNILATLLEHLIITIHKCDRIFCSNANWLEYAIQRNFRTKSDLSDFNDFSWRIWNYIL